jgi:hypothetical protein
MKATVHYAAYSYLDEWMYRDSRFHRALAFGAQAKSTEEGTRVLVETASYYGVARTLRKTNETSRMDLAYRALQDTQFTDGDNVVGLVEDFAKSLQAAYGLYALSAASKFLWMRFRSPVVIYDSVVSEWLHKNCGYSYDGYRSYYDLWSAKYLDSAEQIKHACAELTEAAVKKFTLACEISDEELADWTTSRWFRERVFDHYMIALINTSDENENATQFSPKHPHLPQHG